MEHHRQLVSNEDINADFVRVYIEFEELGIMKTAEALAMARSRAMDLVLVAPNANPPVCRFLQPGSYNRTATDGEGA